MAIHAIVNVANKHESLRLSLFKENVSLIKSDRFTVKPYDIHEFPFIAECTEYKLVYMCSKQCLFFEQDTIIMPVFGDGNCYIVHDGKAISHGNESKLVFANNVGIANTGAYCLFLVGVNATSN
jgi:hypothetical protein